MPPFPTKPRFVQTTGRASGPTDVYARRVSTLPLLDALRRPQVASSSPTAIAPSTKAQTAPGHRAIGVAVVVFLVLLQTTAQFVSGHEISRIFGHLAFLAVELPTIMIALSLTYATLKRRHASAPRAVATTVLVAGTLGAGFGILLCALAQHFPTVMLRPIPNFTFARSALYGFSHSQVHMGLWALAFAYPFAIDEARTKDLEAEQLRSAAELAQLRAHLEPHFLLNTLNAIAGLVTEDPREARRLIGCLGDLLRDALKDDNELQTLQAQVAWLQRYAAILQARHAGELAFEWDIATDTRNVLLPRLLLQPLVENAVKHGALQRSGDGKVAVRTRWVGGEMFECAVEDNGPGAPAGQVRPGAFGLRAVTRRVELKYPGARVSLETIADGSRAGTCARVQIPRAALGTGDRTPDRPA